MHLSQVHAEFDELTLKCFQILSSNCNESRSNLKQEQRLISLPESVLVRA